MLSRKLIYYHTLSWKISGIWHWPDEPMWYTVYSYSLLILCTIIFPVTMVVQLFFTRQLNVILEIFTILPTAFAGLKLCLMIRDRQLIIALFDLLSKLDAQVHSSESLSPGTYGHEWFPVKLRLFYLITSASYVVLPFLSDERILVWNAWFPFDYCDYSSLSSTIAYYVIVLFQSVSTFYIAFTLSSTDIFAACVYNILASHLKLLCSRLSAIGWLDAPNDRRRQHLSKTQQRQCELQFRDCIALHFDCIRYVREIIRNKIIQIFLAESILIRKRYFLGFTFYNLALAF